MTRCPWKIHWGMGQESTTQCDKDDHGVVATPEGPRWYFGDDYEHSGPGLPQFPDQRIVWQAGDRREYIGDWPGLCPHQPCILHTGHHGRHAP